MSAPAAALSSQNGIQFSAGGYSCTLNYLRAEGGEVLSQDVIAQLPASIVQDIASAAQKFFAVREVNQRFGGSVSQMQFGFSGGVSIKDGFGNWNRVAAEEHLWKAFLQEVKKADFYVRRCGIGPYQNAAKPARQTALPPYFADLNDKINEISARTIFKREPKSSPVMSNFRAAVGIGNDCLSFTRNVLRSIDTVGPDHHAVGVLGNILIPLFGVSSFLSLRSSVIDMQTAMKIGDREGVRDAAVRSGEAVTYFLGTSFWGGNAIASAVGSSAALALGSVSSGFFGLGSFVTLGVAGYNLRRCLKFSSHINGFMDNPTLTPEQKVRGVLNFFRDQICLTQEDTDAIIASVKEESNGLSVEQMQTLIDSKVSDAVKVKIAALKRRTGNKSIKEIIQKTFGILERLDNPQTKEAATREGLELVEVVKTENTKRQIFYYLIALASLFAIAALVVGTFFTAGALPFILAGVGALIWLVIGVWGAHSYFKHRSDMENAALPMGSVELGYHL